MNKLHVKKGDTVTVLSGKNKGKKGKVMDTSPSEGKVIIQGVNIATKHVKPKKMGAPGGLVKVEAPLYASKVMLVCPRCGKATRIAHRILPDGTKERVCKNKECGESF